MSSELRRHGSSATCRPAIAPTSPLRSCRPRRIESRYRPSTGAAAAARATDARDDGGSQLIKSISLLTRKAGMTHAQFVAHWVDVHAPLALSVPGLRRYVQSHIVEERTRPDIPATDVDIDGIAELWYDDREV